MLTQPGLELLDHVRAMGEAASRISLTATGQSQAIEGRVRISASDSVAAYLLPGALERLQRVAPGIEVEIIVSNELSDLRRREADIAVRHVRPTEPELIARLVRDSVAHIYAAPAYLGRHGRPRSVKDLTGALFVGIDRSERTVEVLRQHGLNVTGRNFRLFCANTLVGWELVKRGLAIGVMVREVAALTPGVERILPEFEPIPVPVWLTTHRELHTSRRIRLVYDLLAEEMARW